MKSKKHDLKFQEKFEGEGVDPSRGENILGESITILVGDWSLQSSKIKKTRNVSNESVPYGT
jgi:hypothetical protein